MILSNVVNAAVQYRITIKKIRQFFKNKYKNFKQVPNDMGDIAIFSVMLI